MTHRSRQKQKCLLQIMALFDTCSAGKRSIGLFQRRAASSFFNYFHKLGYHSIALNVLYLSSFDSDWNGSTAGLPNVLKVTTLEDGETYKNRFFSGIYYRTLHLIVLDSKPIL